MREDNNNKKYKKIIKKNAKTGEVIDEKIVEMEDDPKKPIYKRKWFIALAIIFGLGFLGSLSPQDEDQIAKEKALEDEQAIVTEVQQETEITEAETETEEPETEQETEAETEPETEAVVAEENTFTEVEVVNVVDGDTIDIVDETGEEYRVRLILVDTPETKHPNKGVEFYGQEASDFTTSMLAGETVYLEKDVSETDRYGRLLAYVWLARPESNDPTDEELYEHCFNSILLEEGYAQLSSYPPDIKYIDQFRTRERLAREEGKGLWNEEAELAYNEQYNAESEAGADIEPEEAVEVSGEAEVEEAFGNSYVADTTQGKIKGNRNSMIYHCPGQRNYNDISVNNVVYFDSEEEAQAAGYRKAKR